MKFNNEMYEKAFPRKVAEPAAVKAPVMGNVTAAADDLKESEPPVNEPDPVIDVPGSVDEGGDGNGTE